MSDIIDPRTLRGFRDSLPQAEVGRLAVQEKLTRVFQGFGFVPIDTPVLEYAEILLGKGGGDTDKQVYRFRDHGDRDVAMRFDLTVPFARFMAAHSHELYLPFKRYHMAKVWRGENTQRGRYREFIQIDFDVVGTDSASADFETLMVMQESFRALGVPRFRIHVSHRELFNLLLSARGLAERYRPALRIVDKLRKIGPEEVRTQLVELAGEAAAGQILEFVTAAASSRETLRRVGSLLPADCPPLRRLEALWRCIEECGLEEFILFDPAITRGLDYYTGVVFETFLTDLPDIGSVCSGGRYNDLASLYTREKLPGVGASIGLDRLMAALEELGLAAGGATAPDALILLLDEELLAAYHRLAASLRAAGLAVEVYPEARKLAVQLKYAEKRAIPLVVIFGPEEQARGLYTLKDLRDRRSHEGLSAAALAETATRLLRS
jgi:histidyl-tRNA synthetase